MPSPEIIFERSTYVGIILSCFLFGIDFVLWFHSCRLLLSKRPRLQNRKFYIAYSSIMLVLVAISIATNCAFGDLMWIDDRNIPGGPAAYYAENSSAWYNVFGTAVDVAANAMADGLLLYRCFVFWHDYRWVLVFPALIYMSSVAMSIIMTIESALPGAKIFQGTPTNFAVPWIALTVSFNIIVTMMIIGRLLRFYWRVREAMPDSSSSYINISAMLTESALPFSVLGIAYLICQVVGSNVVVAFAFVWGTFLGIAPQLIIYRVALGVAWSSETTYTVTRGICFASNSQSGVQESCDPGSTTSDTLGRPTKVTLQLFGEEKA